MGLTKVVNFSETDDGVSFGVRVTPKASKSEVVGAHDGLLKVRIAAPPVDGAANAELIKLLAKTFGASKGSIEIISGQTSKNKNVRIAGITAEKISAVLATRS